MSIQQYTMFTFIQYTIIVYNDFTENARYMVCGIRIVCLGLGSLNKCFSVSNGLFSFNSITNKANKLGAYLHHHNRRHLRHLLHHFLTHAR